MGDMVRLGASHGEREVDALMDFVSIFSGKASVGYFFQNAENGASSFSIFGGNEWLGKNTIRLFFCN